MSAEPQSLLSGCAKSPFPLMVFDDDLPPVGGLTNCTIRPCVTSQSVLPVAPQVGNKGYKLTGVTRDSTGAALAACTVYAYRGSDGTLVAQTISDGSGNYTLVMPTNANFFIVAFKAGAPDVFGASDNNLVPV